MKKLTYEVRFVTPAFLGNAEQKGQWRTPPFKALLREWWRVVKAKDVGYDHNRLREEEGLLFGHAWLEHEKGNAKKEKWAMQSRLRFRIDDWRNGDLENRDWPGGKLQKVTTTHDGKGQVRSDVYLGFGAVLPPSKKQGRSGVELQNPPAIRAESTINLKVQWDSETDVNENEVYDAMLLAHWFGAIGSRSRNGWGSMLFTGDGVSPALPKADDPVLEKVIQPLEECLSRSWPHAIGKDEDEKPLVWLTKTGLQTWHDAIDFLADIKVKIRRVAKEFHDSGVGGIHLLGYPAGEKWVVANWEKKGTNEQQQRLACQLHFKVFEERANSLRAVIVHLPSSIPDDLLNKLTPVQKNWFAANQMLVWQAIHKSLDNNGGLGRIGEVII